MGAHTFEAGLRRRLLFLVVPVVVGVAVVAVVATSQVLERADREAAQSHARELLLQLRAELGEGDGVDEATNEVLRGRDDAFRALVRGDVFGPGRSSTLPLPSRLTGLRPGECARTRDDAGHLWLGCCVGQGALEAVAGFSVQAHREVLVSLARWMLAAVAFAIFGLAFAVRRAVRGPVAALGELVEWSDRIVRGDAVRAPPAANIVEFERLTRSFEGLVEHLVAALARERATSAHMAHELRTPLTTLRAGLEALGELGEEGPSPVTHLLADVDHLARVIDAILVLSAPSNASTRAGVVNVADVARELAPPGAHVEAPDEALVDADAPLVELALYNLLENAERYSGSPARAVRVTRTSTGIKVSVVDDGPGLEESARSRMFDRYWRGGEGVGTGLGLALVRAVAERYGGAAEAVRSPDGRGLEVSMTFGRVLGWHSGGPSSETSGPG
jgi:signal transduction histidine kinase